MDEWGEGQLSAALAWSRTARHGSPKNYRPALITKLPAAALSPHQAGLTFSEAIRHKIYDCIEIGKAQGGGGARNRLERGNEGKAEFIQQSFFPRRKLYFQV